MNGLAAKASFHRTGAIGGAWGGRGLKRSRGGLFPDCPDNRHSEVLFYLARPGSGWAAKANFSNNDKSISIIAQYDWHDYAVDHAVLPPVAWLFAKPAGPAMPSLGEGRQTHQILSRASPQDSPALDTTGRSRRSDWG